MGAQKEIVKRKRLGKSQRVSPGRKRKRRGGKKRRRIFSRETKSCLRCSKAENREFTVARKKPNAQRGSGGGKKKSRGRERITRGRRLLCWDLANCEE